MKTFFYIDKQNFVVYHDFKDSTINRKNPNLRAYQMEAEFTGIFARYYRLKLHPLAKQNILK